MEYNCLALNHHILCNNFVSLHSQRLKHSVFRALIENNTEARYQIRRHRSQIYRRGNWQQYFLSSGMWLDQKIMHFA